jgi:hypothetical protein
MKFTATMTWLTKWLSGTALSHAIQTSGWLIPTLQTIHILCVATVISAAIIVDLRICGIFDRNEPLLQIARRFLPVIWPVLLVLLLTGSLLVVAEPHRSLQNSTFILKMALLVVAVCITAGLQASINFSSGVLDNGTLRGIAVRFAACCSILIWCGIVFAGRWIAYTGPG